MKDIKVKEKFKTGIKTIDKSVVWTSNVKDTVSDIRERSNMINDEKTSNVEYADNKIEMIANKSKNATVRGSKKVITKTKDRMIKNYKNKQVDKIKNSTGKKIKSKAVKQVKDTPKNVEMARKAAIRTKQAAQKTAKATAVAVKKITKAIVASAKALIASAKSLIALLGTGGVIALVVVILICLIGLLCSSIFGIFFSNNNSRTMNSVITQINNEIYQKAEKEQMLTPNSEIVIDNTVTNWREVIAVYSVKYANDKENSDIIMYINDKNVRNIRNVFNDFNKVIISKASSNGYLITTDGSFIQNNSSNVQTKTEDGKTIIHLTIQSKSLDDMMNQYKFTDEQKKNVRELLSDKYEDLWMQLLYGTNVGDFVNWKQTDSTWSSTPIGKSGKNLGQIGCLATSISILIERSGAGKTIMPFTPQTFVEKMNENGGFDDNGNLQYGAITKFIPTFKFVGRVDLKGKNKAEKYKLINQYQSKNYYLAVEVMGDTGQHWVAVIDTNGNKVTIADPGSDAIDLWTKYNWKNTSQFVYFKNN